MKKVSQFAFLGTNVLQRLEPPSKKTCLWLNTNSISHWIANALFYIKELFSIIRPDFFLLVDLQNFFSRLSVKVREKKL